MSALCLGPTLLFSLHTARYGAVFGYTTLAHKEETHKTDKKGEEAVGQLPAWLGNTPARPPERSPALGNVFAPVGKERLQTQDLYNPQPLFQLPLLLFSWAPRGISEDHPSSQHVMNQFRLSSCCHLYTYCQQAKAMKERGQNVNKCTPLVLIITPHHSFFILCFL